MQIRPAVKDPTFSGEKAKTQNRSFKVFPPSFEMHGETEIQNRQKKRESKELKRRKKELETEMGLVLIFETDFETAKK